MQKPSWHVIGILLLHLMGCASSHGGESMKPLPMKVSHWSPLDWISWHKTSLYTLRFPSGDTFVVKSYRQHAYDPFPALPHGGRLPILGAIRVGRENGTVVSCSAFPDIPPFRVEQNYNLELLNQYEGVWFRAIWYSDPDQKELDGYYVFAKVVDNKWVDIDRSDFPKQIALPNFVMLDIDTSSPDFSERYNMKYTYGDGWDAISWDGGQGYGHALYFWHYLLTGKASGSLTNDFPESEARAFFETYIKPNWKFKDQLESKDSAGLSVK